MNWEIYENEYREKAEAAGIPKDIVEKNLSYALELHKKNVPVIYDQNHLALLVGIEYEYLLKASNSSTGHYRSFFIKKSNGNKRTIHEPLPNLKLIQRWILNEILYSIEVNAHAKAYRKGYSIKENVKFHRRQKKVLRLDITNFFNELKQNRILNIFLNLGYSMEVSVMLAKLCTVNGRLPQGAPTSACLSNIILNKFDQEISTYCLSKKIRYTRYADDMTFSGDFKEAKLIAKVTKVLDWHGLELNKSKTQLMRSHNRQVVTGITVNEKIQVSRISRRAIRQKVYFIKKLGLIAHMENSGLKSYSPLLYLKSLKGKVDYCVFINPKDHEMISYQFFLIKEMEKY